MLNEDIQKFTKRVLRMKKRVDYKIPDSYYQEIQKVSITRKTI
jgi:hypothetical protein